MRDHFKKSKIIKKYIFSKSQTLKKEISVDYIILYPLQVIDKMYTIKTTHYDLQ